MLLVRTVVGEQLRRRRLTQQRTLREVSRAARVSLGSLSELERGRKEASSELLAAICDALELPLSALLRDVSDDLALASAGARSRSRRASRSTAPPDQPRARSWLLWTGSRALGAGPAPRQGSATWVAVTSADS